MQSKKHIRIAVALFLAVELIVAILFLWTSMGYGRLLRFLSVALACLFCLLFRERTWVYVTTQLGLFLSVGADAFLTLPSSPIQLPGVLCFAAAYLACAARLYVSESRPHRRKAQICWRVAVSCAAVVITVLVLGKGIDALAVAAVFCYVNLVLNFCFACTQFRQQAFMAMGLLLFMVSDAILGLLFAKPYFALVENPLLDSIIHSGVDLVWAFYLPAQVLLALSLVPARLKSLPGAES